MKLFLSHRFTNVRAIITPAGFLIWLCLQASEADAYGSKNLSISSVTWRYGSEPALSVVISPR